jgi:hypothetical protein
VDSMFEGRLAVGIVANGGTMVRIEGNTIGEAQQKFAAPPPLCCLAARERHLLTA